MKPVLTIARREVAALLASPTGWVCLFAFCSMGGVYFSMIMWAYFEQYSQAMLNPDAAEQMTVNDWVIQPTFNFLYVVSIMVMPFLTMRLLAEDRRQRVMELLLTSPISSFQIASGKLLGALCFSAVMALFTTPLVAILYALGEPDNGVVIANYAAFLMMNAALMSSGLWFSSLTENQIVAAVLSIFFGLFLWIFGFIPQIVQESPWKDIAEGLSLLSHAESLGKGILRISNVGYFATFIGFFLFATTQRVEALRWR